MLPNFPLKNENGWWLRPLDRHAPTGGEIGLDGIYRKGGEFLPFYVPREIMPQVDEEDTPELISFARAEGVRVTEGKIDPEWVKPHQRIAMDKVHAMPDSLLLKPCLISVEPNILDGNHRWMKHHLTHSKEMPFVRFHLEFGKAIDLIFRFPKSYAYGDGNYHPEKN